MRLRQRRSGNTYVLILLVLAVIGLGIWTWRIQSKARTLSVWAAQTDDAARPNFTGGGLTSYLINLTRHLEEHEKKPVAPGGAHHPSPPDNHLDPPPPPPW